VRQQGYIFDVTTMEYILVAQINLTLKNDKLSDLCLPQDLRRACPQTDNIYNTVLGKGNEYPDK